MQMENKTPPVFPELAPGAAGPAHQTHPWKLQLSLWAGAAAQPGLGTDGDGTGSVHQRLLPMPVVEMEIIARDRPGFIYQQCIIDLEQKYWSEGGTQLYLKNRLGWLTAQDGVWLTITQRGDPALRRGHHCPHSGEGLLGQAS